MKKPRDSEEEEEGEERGEGGARVGSRADGNCGGRVTELQSSATASIRPALQLMDLFTGIIIIIGITSIVIIFYSVACASNYAIKSTINKGISLSLPDLNVYIYAPDSDQSYEDLKRYIIA